MPATYEKIAATTLASTTATFQFTSIPATYTDLAIMMSGQSSSTSYLKLNINGTGNADFYSNIIISGDGSTVEAVRQNSGGQVMVVGTYTAGTIVNIQEINILNYSSATGNKSVLFKDDSSLRTRIGAGGYGIAEAITSLSFTVPDGSPFQIGSTFSLYGIKAA